jgi:predicted TPR repeat methyltransferase
MSNNGNDEPHEPSATREVTLEDAIRAAQHLQRTREFDRADAVYQQILAAVPDEPNALHFLGVLRHQQGRNDEAIDLIRRAATLLPGDSGLWMNLGNVLMEAQRYDDAVDAYKQAAEYAPGNVLIYSNLGLLYARLNHFELAEASFRHALSLAPNAEYALYNYARMLQRQGRNEEAVAYYIKMLHANPSDPKARRMLSRSHALLGDMESARGVLREWLALDPGNPQALHLLAAAGGSDAPVRASNDFIAAEFDSFSKSFDADLELLGYRAPELVADALTRAIAPATSAGDVLDAGCGTGLCAAHLRPMAERLDGVDLSQGMLAKAAARGGYDSLVQAELTEFLTQHKHKARWNAIVSADTLCYFGDLRAVFAAAKAALRAQGLLVFSVEALEHDETGYRLHYHGRYAHTRSYLETSLRAAGFALVSIEPVALRLEVLRPVQGWVVVARHVLAYPQTQ